MSADNWTICPKCGDPAEKDYENWNFREDYQIGTWRGVFFVKYRGECRKCKFKKEFEHREELRDDVKSK